LAARTVHKLFRSVVDAEKAFEQLVECGVKPEAVSVIARGVAVDQRLLRDEAMNANSAALQALPIDNSLLARRLSTCKRYLVEGCWVLGPFIEEACGCVSMPVPGDVLQILAAFGLSTEEAARIESQIQGPGGVWLGLRGEGADLERLERAIG